MVSEKVIQISQGTFAEIVLVPVSQRERAFSKCRCSMYVTIIYIACTMDILAYENVLLQKQFGEQYVTMVHHAITTNLYYR